MSKKNLLNIFLLVIVAILALVIYNSDEAGSELEKLTRIDPDSISSFSIIHNDKTSSFIKDSTGHWKITHPVEIAANDFRINSLLKLLNAPVHTQYNVSAIDLEKTGIANSKTALTFNQTRIIFGNINPATSLRFVKISDTVYTIKDVYFPLLNSHFSTLVSLNLLPEDSAASIKFEKLVLLNQTLTKNDKGFWQSNIDMPADNINKTLEHWRHDQAFGVHQYLERKQLGEVFIYTSKPQQLITFQITDTDPWLILARPELGLEYHLDIEAYDNLIAPQ